jgi:hypothetical protein
VKRFQFRLEAVLRLRRAEQEQARLALAQANMALKALLLERDRFIESLFRNGYRRGAFGGYKVPAKDGKGWVQAKRSLFGPKVYDTHVGASGHLLGRSIIVEMEPDDSVDRALDADLKAEALESVRTWIGEEAKRALSAWSDQRFRAHWRSAPFRARVRALQGRSGRDHVIGAILLATCDLMGWSFDSEIRTILAGRATLEEEGAEAEVLDALRDIASAPTPGLEVLFADLLAKVNEARKKAGISKQFNRKTLASALAELGFRKGDGSDSRHDWYRTNAGPNRGKAEKTLNTKRKPRRDRESRQGQKKVEMRVKPQGQIVRTVYVTQRRTRAYVTQTGGEK